MNQCSFNFDMVAAPPIIIPTEVPPDLYDEIATSSIAVLDELDDSPDDLDDEPSVAETSPDKPVRVRLKLEHKPDGWYIAGLPANDVTECGPYPNRREAADIRAGLLRFYEANPDYAK